MSKKSLTQLEHCRALVAKHGTDLRYVTDERIWLRWEGRWERAQPSALTPLVVASFEEMQLQAAKEQDPNREMSIRAKEHRGHIDAVIDLMSRDPRLQVKSDQLDRDGMLLGVANGVVDLRTGALVPETREMLLTRHCPVDFDPCVEPGEWARFVRDIFGGDEEILDYMQQVAGYSFTGSTAVQEMWILLGAGSNGKSTFLSTLLKCAGTYAQQAGEAVLLDRARVGAPAPEVTRLRGIRLAVLAESEQGVRLNETRMKALVSGDKIAARGLYQDLIEFRPHAKFLLATNHLPAVNGTDDGVWRRLSIVPFEQKFEVNGDPGLSERLEAAHQEVLAWVIQGAVKWHARGNLTRPKAIDQASAAYRDREDSMGAFLREHFDAGGFVMASDFRRVYLEWCGVEGSDPLDPNQVGAQMRLRGYHSRPYGKERRSAWIGLKPKPSAKVPKPDDPSGKGR